MIAAILQAIVFVRSADGSSVLLMHRNKRADDPHRGKYLSLGGHVEQDEDVLTCARREVHEESGLTVGDLVFRGPVLWTGFGAERRDYLRVVLRVAVHADDHALPRLDLGLVAI